MIVIGSEALRYHVHLDRIVRDIDVVGTLKELKCLMKNVKPDMSYPIEGGKKYIIKFNGRICEFEIAWPDSTAEQVVNLNKDSKYYIENADLGFLIVPCLNFLYTLKMSHRFKKNSVNFLKTMEDIYRMRQFVSTDIKDEYKSFFKVRQSEQMAAHPKLNVDKESFFTENFPYVYDHDSIHEVVKHLSKPAYAYFKPEQSDVMTDRKMFEQLPLAVRLYSVLEEAYVLAIERSQVPHGTLITPYDSFLIAMKKVCTSITSGWWREFAWEHYYDVIKMYDDKYIKYFWEGVNAGEVKLHGK